MDHFFSRGGGGKPAYAPVLTCQRHTCLYRGRGGFCNKYETRNYTAYSAGIRKGEKVCFEFCSVPTYRTLHDRSAVGISQFLHGPCLGHSHIDPFHASKTGNEFCHVVLLCFSSFLVFDWWEARKLSRSLSGPDDDDDDSSSSSNNNGCCCRCRSSSRLHVFMLRRRRHD